MNRKLGALSRLTVCVAALAVGGACEALSSATAALSTEAQALADAADVDDRADDSAAADHAGEGHHRRPPPGDDGAPPPPPHDLDIDVPACTPPVAANVELGRGPPPPGFLAPIYDDDESHSLNDTERAALVADLTAGCTARNADVLAGFDVDASGDLNQAEWDAARASFRAARDAEHEALDQDGDGEVSRAEHEDARAELLATWDLDESGDLNADERAAMRADLKALVRTGAPLPPLPLFGPPRGHRPPPSPDDDTASPQTEEANDDE